MRNGSRSLSARLVLSVIPWLLLGLLSTPTFVSAQQVSDEMIEEAVRQSGMSKDELMRRYGKEAGLAGTEALEPPGRTVLPNTEPVVVLPFDSELAAMEAVSDLAEAQDSGSVEDIFGASFFHGSPSLFAPATFGPVPRDYMLGPGDQVVIDVWGEVEFRHERIVERDGSIILPKAGRVSCAGRTLDHVTASVREALSGSYSGISADGEGGNTFVEVNLGRLRAIRVFVVGEVARPGAYEMSSVATVFTALHAAGGPGANGSLRDLRVMRGGEQVGSLDLYRYLLTGSREGDVVLREGDTVFMPARRITVKVSGEVRRPMLYECLPGEDVRTLIEYAGGFTAEAETKIVHVDRILAPAERTSDAPDRVQRDLNLRLKMVHALQDGDVLTVDSVGERLENWVRVSGNVKSPGRYEYRAGETVSGLVARAGGLWSDTMLDRAVIDRIDPNGVYRSTDVHLDAALRGEADDVELQARDALRVFSIWDLKDRYDVSISGAVREPGAFDFREGMTLHELILKAGGLTDAADILHAEVSRLSEDALTSRDLSAEPETTVEVIHVELGKNWLSNGHRFELHPRDRVAIRNMPWWQLQRTVTVRGEVGYPGQYSLERPDERLSSLIARVGGLKPTAFAAGARIVRSKNGVGNVALDLEEALAKPGSDQDAILVAGDEILVPPTPYTVKVTGAVGFSTSIVWESGASLGDYVARAGGYADSADRWKTYVVYPNGMSKQIRRFWMDPGVMPGSVIVVPERVPEDGAGKLETMKEIASIVASVATVWLVIDRTR